MQTKSIIDRLKANPKNIEHYNASRLWAFVSALKDEDSNLHQLAELLVFGGGVFPEEIADSLKVDTDVVLERMRNLLIKKLQWRRGGRGNRPSRIDPPERPMAWHSLDELADIIMVNFDDEEIEQIDKEAVPLYPPEENDDEDLTESISAKVLPFVKPKATLVSQYYGIEKKAAASGSDQETVRLPHEHGKWFIDVGNEATGGSFLEFHCDKEFIDEFRGRYVKVIIGDWESELFKVNENGFAEIVVKEKINTRPKPEIQTFTIEGN